MLTALWGLVRAWLASISDYAENKLVDAWLGTTSFQATACYVKLHTGDPGENGTANAAGETTRKLAAFGAASGGAATNSGLLQWTNVASTETYSHVSLWDASSAGNCLGSGALTSSKSVTAGDTFEIAVGQLAASLD